MSINMAYGKNGLALTESFEKCVLKPYRDGGGRWTNGWGNTHHVDPNITITQDQAERDLIANLQDAVDCVNDAVDVALTQDQFDALCDLVFNIGCGAFNGSTLLRKLNLSDFPRASAQFAAWDRINGLRSRGLDNRRAADSALFNTEDA